MDKILHQPWGGLGDNLQYSTLPEKFNKMGVKFYIHKNNAFRNSEIFDLVWGMNPYVEGMSDDKFNCGSTIPNSEYGLEFINQVEKAHGVELSKEPYPKIYYKPKMLPSFKGKTVVNLASISSVYSKPEIDRIKKELELCSDIIYVYFEKELNVNPFNNDTHHMYDIESENSHKINTIFEHCDIIFSCNKYVCLYSGASVLAAAIKRDSPLPEITAYVRKEKESILRNRNTYNFKNISYKII